MFARKRGRVGERLGDQIVFARFAGEHRAAKRRKGDGSMRPSETQAAPEPHTATTPSAATDDPASRSAD